MSLWSARVSGERHSLQGHTPTKTRFTPLVKRQRMTDCLATRMVRLLTATLALSGGVAIASYTSRQPTDVSAVPYPMAISRLSVFDTSRILVV